MGGREPQEEKGEKRKDNHQLPTSSDQGKNVFGGLPHLSILQYLYYVNDHPIEEAICCASVGVRERPAEMNSAFMLPN